MRVGANKSRKSTMITALVVGGALIIGAILFVMHMNNIVEVEAQVIISDSSFEVNGMYGGIYLFDEVETVELKDTMPEILVRTNGAAIGEVKKGNFKLEELGLCRLYLSSETGPYVYIMVNDFYVIINYPNKDKTQQLYEDLLEKVKE